MMNRFIVLLAIAFCFASCGEKEQPTPPQENTLTGVNKWMRDELEAWYFWRDAVVKSQAPSNRLAFGEFMASSLLPLADARDADGTMDGGYTDEGDRYLYSRIERFSGGTRAVSTSEQPTFGFGVIVLQYTNSSELGILVTWVMPNGPAYNAGLRRGMILDQYNGQPLHRDDVDTFGNHLFSQFGTPMNVTCEDGTKYTINGETVRVDPILDYRTLETEKGKRVAYLMYNSFEQGGDIDRDELGEFDRELRTVFGGFKAAGATELVLDLRYNGGGAVRSAQLLSSLIGNVDDRQVFANMLYNNNIDIDNPQVWNFRNEPGSMKLARVYLLVTEQSASASELVINSLRGVGADVVLIGEQTEGKNVGMNLLEHTEGIFRYEFWPITFKSSNAKGFSDYSDGFVPNVKINELEELFGPPRGELYGFGDPDELLLYTALRMIDGEQSTRGKETRAASADFRTTTLNDPQKGGARVYNLPVGK